MTDIKLNNSTLATASGSTISWGSGVPTGTMVYIKNATFSGFGSVGDQLNWYPLDLSADGAKTLHGNLSATEHAPFSKIKIEFSIDMRVNKASYSHIDVRLVRWQGTATAPSTLHSGETTLYLVRSGDVNNTDETYLPVAGSSIDDISSLSGTIYYAIQYRNAAGNETYAGTMYAGADTNNRHQMIFTGIV